MLYGANRRWRSKGVFQDGPIAWIVAGPMTLRFPPIHYGGNALPNPFGGCCFGFPYRRQTLRTAALSISANDSRPIYGLAYRDKVLRHRSAWRWCFHSLSCAVRYCVTAWSNVTMADCLASVARWALRCSIGSILLSRSFLASAAFWRASASPLYLESAPVPCGALCRSAHSGRTNCAASDP